MNIVFVVGGSYKAFYINNINKLKKIDLLVFQENILYEFDYYNELLGAKTVTNEMINLATTLNCKIVAIVSTNFFGEKSREILYADNEKVSLISDKNYLDLIIDKIRLKIGVDKLKEDVSIFLKLYAKKLYKMKIWASKGVSFFCNKSGVKMIKNGKIKRKNRKICYFCLPF